MSENTTQKEDNEKALREPLLNKDWSEGTFNKKEESISLIDGIKTIFNQAMFPILSFLLQSGYHLVNARLVGYSTTTLDRELDLAALGLGNLTLSIFLYSLGISFNGSLSTLVSQAYGQKEYRLCGIYLNRQIYINMAITFPISLYLLFFSKWTFIVFGVTE